MKKLWIVFKAWIQTWGWWDKEYLESLRKESKTKEKKSNE